MSRVLDLIERNLPCGTKVVDRGVILQVSVHWSKLKRDSKVFCGDPKWSPRVQCLLDRCRRKPEHERALLQVFKSVLVELNTQALKHKVQLDRFKSLELLNPQFLCTHDTTWETNKPLLKLPDHFLDEWNGYVTMDVAKAQSIDDTLQFWAQQTGSLAKYATALLSTPPTSADVERTFSLAGVLDSKLRISTRPELRRCTMALYSNGNVEGRF